jgi:hypothetical protein
MQMGIPPRRRLATWRAQRGRPVVASRDEYRQRFKVERRFACLWQLSAVAHPLGHRFDLYRSFFVTALLLIGVRRTCSL